MKKLLSVLLCIVFITLFTMPLSMSEVYSGPYSFDPIITNYLTEKMNMSDQLWMYDSTTRAILSVCLLLDSETGILNPEPLELEDFARLDSSYVFLQKNHMSVLYRGAGRKKEQGIVLMYSSKDKDAAYSIYYLDGKETTFAHLTKALKMNSEEYYENDISEIMKAWERLGDDPKEEPTDTLIISDIIWEKKENNTLAVQFEVDNKTNKTIINYTIMVQAEDKDGYSIKASDGFNLFYKSTQQEIAPGQKNYSEPVLIGQEDEIAVITAAISRIRYSDETNETIKDNYFYDWDYK